ncbi:myosin ii heavy chain [Diplodia corticola]|uniref:Myosin ii heavy chain n=1 Tax=Diplodia corticola TaxID=236234 RepID=A0A1J9RR69_9PEZI|nr:myosin ii heavy chain [Diplodia corticola]OJD30396.1 myosin ii heavy chain [Diplodia corticola]
MPSPEAGGDHHTESLGGSPQSELNTGTLTRDFALAAAVVSEQHAHLTQTASQPTHSPPSSQPSALGEVHRNSRTVPIRADDAPSRVIKRPRSSGDPLFEGFKYGKAKEVRMDMTRKRAPKPHTVANQGQPGAPLIDDAKANMDAQGQLAREDAGVEQRNDTTSEEPLHSSQESHRADLNALPSQEDHTTDPSFHVTQADHDNTKENPSPRQAASHIPTQRTPYSRYLVGKSTEEQRTEHGKPPLVVAGSAEKVGPSDFSSAFDPLPIAPPLPTTAGNSAEGASHEQRYLTSSLGSATWAEIENNHGRSTTSGTASSQVRSRPRHHRVQTLIQQDYRAMMPDNTRKHGLEQSEHTVDAHLPRQADAVTKQSFHEPCQHQELSGIKEQSSRNVPHRRDPKNLRSDSSKDGQLHNISTQAGPTQVTKTGAGAKRARGNIRATKGTSHSGEPRNTPGSGFDIHSSHVLSIWQKLFEKEQEELTAKEVAKRESCELEVNRLRSAEQEHEAALKAVTMAKMTASTRMHQLRSINEELNARIQELETSLTNTSHKVKELQRDKKNDAKVLAKAEKKVELLEADRKSLVASYDDEKRKVSQEHSTTILKLAETQKDLENAKESIERLDTEVSQKCNDLAEQKNRVAQLLKNNEDMFIKYNDIEEAINSLGDSLDKPLGDLAHSVKELLEQQATKRSADEIMGRIKNITSLLSDERADFSSLQAALQSMDNSFQTKFDNLMQSTQSSRQDEKVIENRLLSRLQEEFKSLECWQEDLVETKSKKAALEERCNALQHNESQLQTKLDAATGAQEAAQRSLVEMQTELSCVRSSLTVDSARLQQLEISKATADQELRDALARIHEEEQKCRALSVVEQELRQEVMQLKEQLINAKDTMSNPPTDSGKGRTDSTPIESASERARVYYAKHSRDVIQDTNTKHANALYAERMKVRQAGETLESQSAQIAALKEQIHRKDSEIQSLNESDSVENPTKDDLKNQLEVARADNTRIQKLMQTEYDEKLEEIQQQLDNLQTQKQEIDLKYQQIQPNNDTVQEQLRLSNNELAGLYRQLEETQVSLKESEQEAAQQKIYSEEMLRQREEQWAVEANGMRGQLQEANTQMQEIEASHQIQREEYEAQLRYYLHERENDEPGQFCGANQQLIHPIEDKFRHPPSISSKLPESPVLEVMMPAANSGSTRKPRRKLDRSNKSVSHAVDKTQPEQSQIPHNSSASQRDTQPGLEDSRKQVYHRSSDGSTFGEDFWVSQELGKHERLTEHGVTLLPTQGEATVEDPETLSDLLSKPKLFSEIAKEHVDDQNKSTSSLSSLLSSDMDIPEGLAGLHLQPDDAVESTPTPRFRGADGTVRRTTASMENPFFEEDRPVSQANTSRRMNSAYQLRQESYRSDSVAVDASLPRTPFHAPRGITRMESDQGSSPLFMDQAKSRNNATYSHHHTTQSTNAEQSVDSSPSGAVKRLTSGESDEYSSKRIKGTSSKYRSSPIMTRAISRAGPRSQVSETQSQDLRVRFPEESSQVSAKAESQTQTATSRPPQPPSQRSTRVPSMSRMKTSEGSSWGGIRNSPPRNARKRKADEIGGRFDQEIKSSY